ncbi:glycosyltransferase family 4 protein [Mesotoga sp. TolDC]|uniref:glycosyltransferase family 4 protein n=2 Tax=unclassified Mesotoga TaxID=1184398 RepID=UPI0015E8B8A6|nr:glycosyltransferase family 4 protein [Mesotoga sp. TolDC]
MHEKLLSYGLDSLVVVPAVYNSDNRAEEKNVRQIKCFGNYDRFFYYRKQRKITRSIEELTHQYKPQIIHSHFVFSGGYTCLKIKEELGIPYVVTVRNTDLNLFFRRMHHLRGTGIEILRRADKIVFISKTYLDKLLEKYIPVPDRKAIVDKSVILPNGIDDFWFENRPRSAHSIENGKIKLLTVGAINKNKNQIIVSSVANYLRKKGYDVEYTMVGKIENRTLFRKIMDQGLTTYVEPKPKETLIEYYRSSDIFVMPSIHETFGLVYAEAISQGIPIIYTKGEGFDSQFPDGTIGFSVKRNDADDISCKVLSILDDYDNISAECLAKSAKFKWDTKVEDYIRLYQEIGYRH